MTLANNHTHVVLGPDTTRLTKNHFAQIGGARKKRLHGVVNAATKCCIITMKIHENEQIFADDAADFISSNSSSSRGGRNQFKCIRNAFQRNMQLEKWMKPPLPHHSSAMSNTKAKSHKHKLGWLISSSFAAYRPPPLSDTMALEFWFEWLILH